jgi:hypothetical protein
MGFRKEFAMRYVFLKLALVVAVASLMSGSISAQTSSVGHSKGPHFRYIGPLAIGPNDTLFAADSQEVSIYSLQLGKFARGGVAGTKSIPEIDRKIAALLGTVPADVVITDMKVLPKTHNTFISVMRGQGPNALAVLLRVDGAGKIENIPLDQISYTKVKLPNPPGVTTAIKIGQREFVVPNYPDRTKTDDEALNLFSTQTITDMAFDGTKLYVSGLSNEEFASKLRVISYPFKNVDNGTSVEIWHGDHGQFETRSPIYSFVPYKIGGVSYLIASYLCTPLVKIPVSALKPNADVRGETIGEFGNRNRPLDMIIYTKNGQDFLLMSNNNRGVMKVPTGGFGSAEPITKKVNSGERVGVVPEPIPSLKGIEQLDLLDSDHALILARNSENGSISLAAIDLP